MSSLKHKATFATGIGLVLTNRLLQRAGLQKRRDGWRRGAGLLLRGEHATFVLSTFNLNVWSDAPKPVSITIEATQQHLVHRLANFLAGETALHIFVQRSPSEDRAHASPGPSYTLGFQPAIDGPARFIRPDAWTGENGPTPPAPSADVLLNIIARVDPDGSADLWFRVNHVGADGVPVQEMISRIESAWGISRDVAFPTPDEFAPHTTPRLCPGREGLIETQAFIDFAPLIAWRKSQNARLPQPMTFSAAMMWCLAEHPAFAQIYMGTTVDVPAIDGLARGVGVVVTHPAAYSRDAAGLSRYVQDFNRELDLSRTRQSSGFKTLDAAACVSPAFAAPLLRHALQGNKAFGTLGLTILKDAKVFGAPIGDFGHPDGFIAIGNTFLSTSSSQKVGCIHIKGPADRTANYPALIQQAINKFASNIF